jgi:transposase-like protein
MARQYSKQFKLECADSIIEGSATLKGLAKENNMNPNVLSTWVAKRKSGNMKNWPREPEIHNAKKAYPPLSSIASTNERNISNITSGKVTVNVESSDYSEFTQSQINTLQSEIDRLHKEQIKLQSAIDVLKASY